MQYTIFPTAHNTQRLVVNFEIMEFEKKVDFLNFMSIWGAADKVEDNWPGFSGKIVSWEFSTEIPKFLITKLLR